MCFIVEYYLKMNCSEYKIIYKVLYIKMHIVVSVVLIVRLIFTENMTDKNGLLGQNAVSATLPATVQLSVLSVFYLLSNKNMKSLIKIEPRQC